MHFCSVFNFDRFARLDTVCTTLTTTVFHFLCLLPLTVPSIARLWLHLRRLFCLSFLFELIFLLQILPRTFALGFFGTGPFDPIGRGTILPLLLELPFLAGTNHVLLLEAGGLLVLGLCADAVPLGRRFGQLSLGISK
jgi:hypothetical protein